MPALNAKVSYGCNPNGTGWLQVDSVGSPNQENIEVRFTSPNGGYSAYFPGDSIPFRITPAAAETEYTVTVIGSVSGAGVVSVMNGPFAANGFLELSCFVCDITLPTVNTTEAAEPLANGSATIIAGGQPGMDKEYSLNGQNWQASNVFSDLAVGPYTAWVRYVNVDSCQAQKNFTISPVPVYGCTNPEADNYDPNANSDNGTCVFNARYYPTGGTLPNPVFIERDFAVLTSGQNPQPKSRHYATLNLYLPGEPEPFATKFARVRNGKVKVDIAKELQRGILKVNIGRGLISDDDDALFPFEIGFTESFNGTDQAETRSAYPRRFAVRAALAGYSESIEPYVLRVPAGGQIDEAQVAKFLTAFDEPVKFPGEPLCLAILIDDTIYNPGGGPIAANQIFLERSYFDSQGRLVERISTQVVETGFVRFEINDQVLPCVSYGEVVLTDTERNQAGNCIDPTPNPNPNPGGGGVVTIQDGSGNVLAQVPAGSTFVIESGFSFGFRIL